MSFNTFPQLVNSGFETMHGGVHTFVGGHIGDLMCSPSDPAFWMHHAFVDCIWQKFREERQTTGVETDYPAVTPPSHAATDRMHPFAGLINIDGLGNWTTDIFYQ